MHRISKNDRKYWLQFILWVIITLIFRSFGDIVDAWSIRHPDIAWEPWHLFNWMRRDVVIAYVYFWYLWKRKPEPYFDRIIKWMAGRIIICAILLLINSYWHDFLYMEFLP